MVINIIISLFVSKITNYGTIIAGIMVMITCCGVRIYWRVLRRALKFTEIKNKENIKKVLVIGAGEGGALVSSEYKKHPQLGKKVVGFIDDDSQKLGTYINGIKVLGNRNNIVYCKKRI